MGMAQRLQAAVAQLRHTDRFRPAQNALDQGLLEGCELITRRARRVSDYPVNLRDLPLRTLGEALSSRVRLLISGNGGDGEVTAHGEIDQRRGDVAGVHATVDHRSHEPGGEPCGRRESDGDFAVVLAAGAAHPLARRRRGVGRDQAGWQPGEHLIASEEANQQGGQPHDHPCKGGEAKQAQIKRVHRGSVHDGSIARRGSSEAGNDKARPKPGFVAGVGFEPT